MLQQPCLGRKKASENPPAIAKRQAGLFIVFRRKGLARKRLPLPFNFIAKQPCLPLSDGRKKALAQPCPWRPWLGKRIIGEGSEKSKKGEGGVTNPP